jgi:hypothetical protein
MITTVLARMHTDAPKIHAILSQMASLESDFQTILSSFKS